MPKNKWYNDSKWDFSIWYSSEKACVLFLMKDRHDVFRFGTENTYFIIMSGWFIFPEDAQLLVEEVEETCPPCFPRENITYLVNTKEEEAIMKEAFYGKDKIPLPNTPRIFLSHQNALLDERMFKMITTTSEKDDISNNTNNNTSDPTSHHTNTDSSNNNNNNNNNSREEKRFQSTTTRPSFGMVVNSRNSKNKRIYLAEQVPRVCYISNNWVEPGLGPQPPCSCGREKLCYTCSPYNIDYLPLPNTAFINWMHLSPSAVSHLLNQSICGGIFSPEEGGCYSSTEYLMCGLPVISTKSIGGRDVYYTPENSIIVEEDSPNAVRKAWETVCKKLVSGEMDRNRIVQHVTQLNNQFRQRFIDVLQEIFQKKGIDLDAEKHFYSIRENGTWLPKVYPKEKAISACVKCF